MNGQKYIVNMDKQTAQDTYVLNREYIYPLSPDHEVLVRLTSVAVYGGVVLCTIEPVKVLRSYSPDKTDYKAMIGEQVLAGRLIPA